MRVVVFSGPTLARDEVLQVIPEAVCLPPAAQGDVYRASFGGTEAIGIIDGYFERVPSVWHKEILWAMSRGIHVFGSASMGALRAAELECFGMVGVGAIFRSFRDGVLEDDDEVAVVHGPTEDTYRFSSDAMVNIRATLAQAQAEGVAAPAAVEELLRIAKNFFYPERSWAHILEVGGARGIPDLDRLHAWLPHGIVNQKRIDALAMLRKMDEFLASAPGLKQVPFVFEETMHWRELEADPGDSELPDQAVLEELRRDRQALERAEAAALGWLLAGKLARREGRRPEAAVVLERAEEFCRRNGIGDAAGLADWLDRNRAARDHLDRCLEWDALVLRARGGAPFELAACLIDYLHWTGDYVRLLARAEIRKP